MSELLIIILIISFLALTLTFLLGFVVKKTNSLMKNVFVDKMSEFDFLLEDKEKKVDELNDDIKKKAEIITQLEEKSKGFSGPDTVLSNEVVMPKYDSWTIDKNYDVLFKSGRTLGYVSTKTGIFVPRSLFRRRDYIGLSDFLMAQEF